MNVDKKKAATSLVPIVTGAVISAFGDALVPIAFAIECHRVEPHGWGMSTVLLMLWFGRFLGIGITRKRRPAQRTVRTMVIVDIIRASAQLGLLAALLNPSLSSPIKAITALSLSSFLYGLAAAFFTPARFRTLAELGSGEQLNRVNSGLAMVGDVSALLGPALGSLIVLWLGFNRVLLIDGVSFLIAAALLIPLWNVNVMVDKEAPSERTEETSSRKMPQWFTPGLVTWGVLTLTFGVLGVAGPTKVLSKFGVSGWATVATCLAAGSLLGSTSSLLGISRSARWKTLHISAAALVGLQTATYVEPKNIWVLAVAGFIGSMAVSLSGIRWDTMGQSLRTSGEIHEFSTRDQLVTTSMIPLGMVLYGIASSTGISIFFLGILSFSCILTAVYCISLKKPVESEFRPDHALQL